MSEPFSPRRGHLFVAKWYAGACTHEAQPSIATSNHVLGSVSDAAGVTDEAI